MSDGAVVAMSLVHGLASREASSDADHACPVGEKEGVTCPPVPPDCVPEHVEHVMSIIC